MVRRAACAGYVARDPAITAATDLAYALREHRGERRTGERWRALAHREGLRSGPADREVQTLDRVPGGGNDDGGAAMRKTFGHGPWDVRGVVGMGRTEPVNATRRVGRATLVS